MSDGKGSKKRENIIHALYVVRIHEGEMGERRDPPPIGEKKREGEKVLLANLFFRAEEGRDINTQTKI